MPESGAGPLEALECLPVPVFVHRDGLLLRANRALCTLLGFPPEALEHRPFLDLVDPAEAEEASDQLARGYLGIQAPHRRTLRARDGGRVEVELHSTVAIEIDGLPAFVTTASDSRAQRALLARRLGEERALAEGRMAVGVAHEINNPLAIATANVDAVLRQSQAGLPPGDGLLQLREARAALDRVRRVVASLQRLASPGRKEGPLSLTRLLDLAVEAARAELPGPLEVRRVLRSEEWVEGPAARLAEGFACLLVNAAEACQGGALAEDVVTLRVGSEGFRARVDVEDGGDGIPPDAAPHLFEPFFSTRPGHAGLGLAIARAAMAAAGGTLEHGPRPGGGTRFTVLLPRCPPDRQGAK